MRNECEDLAAGCSMDDDMESLDVAAMVEIGGKVDLTASAASQEEYPFCMEAGIDPAALLGWNKTDLNKCVVKNGLALEIYQIFKDVGKRQAEAVKCIGKISTVDVDPDFVKMEYLKLFKRIKTAVEKGFLHEPLKVQSGEPMDLSVLARPDSSEVQHLKDLQRELKRCQVLEEKARCSLEVVKRELQEKKTTIPPLRRKLQHLDKDLEENFGLVERLKKREERMKCRLVCLMKEWRKTRGKLDPLRKQLKELKEKSKELLSEKRLLIHNAKTMDRIIAAKQPAITQLRQEVASQKKIIMDQKIAMYGIRCKLTSLGEGNFDLYDRVQGYTPETIKCVKELTSLGVRRRSVEHVLESVARLLKRRVSRVPKKDFVRKVVAAELEATKVESRSRQDNSQGIETATADASVTEFHRKMEVESTASANVL